MQYLHKGDKITAVGDLTLRPYKDKNGIDRLSVQLSIGELELPAMRPQSNASAPVADDELPI